MKSISDLERQIRTLKRENDDFKKEVKDLKQRNQHLNNELIDMIRAYDKLHDKFKGNKK